MLKFCTYNEERRANGKAKKLAAAAFARHQIHQGRVQVIEPYMEKFCKVTSAETVPSMSQAWARFLQGASSEGLNLKVLFADCHKFGRMSEDLLASFFDFLSQVAAVDPANFAAIIIPTTVMSKKRLQGETGFVNVFPRLAVFIHRINLFGVQVYFFNASGLHCMEKSCVTTISGPLRL